MTVRQRMEKELSKHEWRQQVRLVRIGLILGLLVLLLAAWVVIDFRKQKRALAELEARGITRRAGR